MATHTKKKPKIEFIANELHQMIFKLEAHVRSTIAKIGK
jgi:hypothetical protein